MTDQEKLAKTLKELREQNNLTQKYISERLDVDVTLVSKWENGQSGIDPYTLRKLAKLYETTVDLLMSYQDKKEEENRRLEEEERQRQAEKNRAIRDALARAGGIYHQTWDQKLGYDGENAHITTEYENGKLILHQKEDPDIVLYESVIGIGGNMPVPSATCWEYRHGQWAECANFESRKNAWSILFDFSNPIEKIKFCFDEPGIDEYVIDVEYIRADRELFLAKKAKEQRDEYILRMQICVNRMQAASGVVYPPINVVFHPANDAFSYAVIELYRHVEIQYPAKNEHDYNPRREKYDDLLKTYRVPDGELIWTNLDLCPKHYSIVLKQFDKDGQLIVASDKIQL